MTRCTVTLSSTQPHATGMIVFISPAVQDILGYTAVELFNQPLATILHPACHAAFEQHVQRCIEIQVRYGQLKCRLTSCPLAWLAHGSVFAV